MTRPLIDSVDKEEGEVELAEGEEEGKAWAHSGRVLI